MGKEGYLIMKKPFVRRATSTLEYALLLVVIMMAFFISQKYIVRGFAGRWKDVGDTFGFGRQYDPKNTTECVFNVDTGNYDYSAGPVRPCN